MSIAQVIHEHMGKVPLPQRVQIRVDIPGQDQQKAIRQVAREFRRSLRGCVLHE